MIFLIVVAVVSGDLLERFRLSEEPAHQATRRRYGGAVASLQQPANDILTNKLETHSIPGETGGCRRRIADEVELAQAHLPEHRRVSTGLLEQGALQACLAATGFTMQEERLTVAEMVLRSGQPNIDTIVRIADDLASGAAQYSGRRRATHPFNGDDWLDAIGHFANATRRRSATEVHFANLAADQTDGVAGYSRIVQILSSREHDESAANDFIMGSMGTPQEQYEGCMHTVNHVNTLADEGSEGLSVVSHEGEDYIAFDRNVAPMELRWGLATLGPLILVVKKCFGFTSTQLLD